MRGLFVSAVVVLGVFAIGCNPEPPKKAKVVMAGDANPKGTSGSNTSGDDDDEIGSADPYGDDSSSPDKTPTENEEPTTPTDPSDPNTPTTPTPQTKSCDSATEGNTSTTKVTYLEQNGKAGISSMTVTISNKGHRNKNDVDVYVTPSGGKETFVLNSKDILMDGQTTTVPLPSNFSVTMGSKIRVQTNFDDSWGDPKQSCTLQF